MPTEFDQYATNYAQVLDQALSATGETKTYYAAERVRHFATCLKRLQFAPRRVLDFGCGPGSTTALLVETLGCAEVVGLDESRDCIAQARQTNSSPQTTFVVASEHHARSDFDAAYCNGVFHHIPPAGRIAALQQIWNSLRPAGLFAFWENNPWNPGTKYVMSACAFDKDAITISPLHARGLLRAAGFEILRLDSLFFFPRPLKFLRGLEPALMKLPLGGQYQVLCRKPR